MLINAMRGHAAEFGITAPKGPQQIGELLRRLAAADDVPALAREALERVPRLRYGLPGCSI